MSNLLRFPWLPVFGSDEVLIAIDLFELRDGLIARKGAYLQTRNSWHQNELCCEHGSIAQIYTQHRTSAVPIQST